MSGKFYDDLYVGQQFVHTLGRTVTEMDNVLFSSLTLNTQPLHINEDFAARTGFGRRIVNGLFTLGLAVGLTVSDLTEGTIVANLGYEAITHPHPLFHGDTLYVSSVVLEMRPSRTQPDRGIVKFHHTGRNQNGDVVIEVTRTVLFLRRPEAP